LHSGVTFTARNTPAPRHVLMRHNRCVLNSFALTLCPLVLPSSVASCPPRPTANPRRTRRKQVESTQVGAVRAGAPKCRGKRLLSRAVSFPSRLPLRVSSKAPARHAHPRHLPLGQVCPPLPPLHSGPRLHRRRPLHHPLPVPCLLSPCGFR
jgi:hypothetical protein